MKPVRIDFVPPRGWISIWSITAVVGLMILGVALAAMSASRQQVHALDAEATMIAHEISRLNVSRTLPADPRAASAARTAGALNADLNKVLLALERLTQEGARLVSVQVEQASGVARVEYELDAMQKVSSITAELNAGNEASPWKFEGVHSTPATGSASGPSARASWRVETRNL